MYKIVHFYITFFVHSYIIINNGLEEVKNKDSYIGFHISVQPIDSFKEEIDKEYEKIKNMYEL